jgi:hypothetical protein
MRIAKQFFCLLLTSSVAFLPLWGQDLQTAAATSSPSSALQIRVVNRDSMQTAGPRATYTLQITDSSGKPVANAAVACRLPDAAPTGQFANGTRSVVLYTAADGLVTLPEIQWNAASGIADIRITAVSEGARGTLLLERNLAAAPGAAPPQVGVVNGNSGPAPVARLSPLRENSALLSPGPSPVITGADVQPSVTVTGAPKGEKIHSGSKKKWIILALVAGAAAAGAAGVAARGKSSSPASSTQMSIGSPTINVGQP